MGSEDRIGIVTVTYNSANVLPDFLRCVFEQTHSNFLLFAVDNASKDASKHILQACVDDQLRVIENTENLGVAAGNNQGIRAALDCDCSAILLLNNDTEFGPDLIAQLSRGLDDHRVDMICPKMMYYDDPGRIWSAGGKFLPWLGYMSKCDGENELDRGQHDYARIITDVPTCCVLIRAEVFRKVGFMDERYFVYVDDSDFMFRAMKAGLKLSYLPSAKLHHKVSSLTGGSDSAFAIHYATRNRIFFQLKHLGFLRTLPWIVVRQLAWIGALLARGKKLDWYRKKNAALISAFEMYRTAVANTKTAHESVEATVRESELFKERHR
jgi:GT2 family glycosyltransferase